MLLLLLYARFVIAGHKCLLFLSCTEEKQQLIVTHNRENCASH